MSLILDALRKSEAERRRGEAPGLFTTLPTPGLRPSHRASPWLWLVAVAIAVAVALAWRFWPTSPIVAVAVVPTPPVVATHAAPVVPTPLPITTTPMPMPIPTPAPAPKTPPDRALPATSPVAPLAPLPPAKPDPAIDEPPLEALPTLAMLDPSERAVLPPLKLSMHVWSEAPNARLAIIDGHRVMEGATIGESIVAEIRRDGVVLEWRGRRFLLPRP